MQEFDRIFHDLFGRKGATYKKILHTLKEGAATLADIRSALSFPHSGTLSELMEHLVVAGFVRKSPLWSFKTGAFGKQSLYHICDPYMRFYLKVIEPNIAKISKGGFESDTLSQLPGFDAHMGLQIEYLLLENRASLLKAIGLRNNEVVCDGPYRQTKTKAHGGCQIDYLIQTRTHNLFVCAFKFKRREIDTTIIEDLTYKLSTLKKPKWYSAIPILFHLGGVTPSVETTGFFYRVIDITDFIEQPKGYYH